MSHLKERKEKNCLNCNAEVLGKYCHICGQENIASKESALHLVAHFFEDITHFDGKFFSTLKYLVLKPGFVSREYIQGRRASYLNPVRMYVFTSAFFFLLFFSFFSVDEIKLKNNDIKVNGLTKAVIDQMDSVSFAAFTQGINKKEMGKDRPMSREEFRIYVDSSLQQMGLHYSGRPKYRSIAEYDADRAANGYHDNWWQRQLIYKFIQINQKYKNNLDEFGSEIFRNMLHRLPQLLFISLPLLALLFKLLYFRRKQFYYVDHAIFSIHYYIFTFIVLLLLFALNKLNGQLHWGTISFLIGLLIFSIFFYLYKAMRNFYQQGRLKTLLKFLLLNFSFLLLILVLFTGLLFFSFLTI